MVLTVSFVLSPVTGLSCHRHQRIKVLSAPGRADVPSSNLTPASGSQDHTTSPSTATSFVSSPFDRSRIPKEPALHHVARLTLPRPPHPAPTSVTIAKRPSVWDGMRKVLDVIWGVRKQKYFCKGNSTQNCPTGKSPRRREQTPLVSRTRCSALCAAPQSRDP